MVYKKYPSKIIEDYWVHAYPKISSVKSTDRSGKWLVFEYAKDLDKTWQKIAKATEKGELGIGAKSATAKASPIASNEEVKVICIYTYDSEDKVDVARVAWKLHSLGVASRVLNYKEDDTTIEGKYAVRGDKKISKYSISIHHFKDKDEKEFMRFFIDRFA